MTIWNYYKVSKKMGAEKIAALMHNMAFVYGWSHVLSKA